MTMDNEKMIIEPGGIAPLGAAKVSRGVQFVYILDDCITCKLMIYDKFHKLIFSVSMKDYIVCGNIASVVVTQNIGDDFTYCYEVDGKVVCDPNLKRLSCKRKYGDFDAPLDEAMLYFDDFDWEGDRPPKLPYSDVIAYQLHVRGFTKHSSSKVSAKGTFGGVIEKIDHFKDLGINQIVLMPCYEFDERQLSDKSSNDNVINNFDYMRSSDEHSVNYWGFKEGLYYCPKANYALHDSVGEFKMMIKALHKAGIEVVMRMYFPPTFNPTFIADILKFYVRDYHVDGFYLMGPSIPMESIASDPALFDTKIYNAFFDKDALKSKSYSTNRNLCFANSDFAKVCRRFLKSDDNMLYDFVGRMRLNPSDVHVMNYITDYCGFTLNDLVSYDYKHNEDNGEDNRDGENFNYSWNCGHEGDTRKKAVVSLRLKQIKNAMIFLLLSQGVPMLLAGDEFLNSQNGNNNPYCQDNDTGWVVWKKNKQSDEVYDFIKSLISLRISHPILHPNKEFRIMDYAACGFPDLSYHSENAWAPRFDNYLRHIGLMLCGSYATASDGTADDFFYIAYNMHWESHKFALPTLPKGLVWKPVMLSDSLAEDAKLIETGEDGTQRVLAGGRSICVIKSEKLPESSILNKNKKRNRKEDKYVR